MGKQTGEQESVSTTVQGREAVDKYVLVVMAPRVALFKWLLMVRELRALRQESMRVHQAHHCAEGRLGIG